MLTHTRLGTEQFWLAEDDASEVQRLSLVDWNAGLSLARRKAERSSVYVSMSMMDGAPAAPPQPLRDAAPSPPPVYPTRTTTMSTMTKVTIGDRDHYVDQAVHRELESLRGENAALRAMRDGAVLPVAAQRGATSAGTAHLSDREFWRAHEAARYDPATPFGSYVEYLQNAHKGGR